MNNTRFATAIHILTVLAIKKDEWLSSDYIAGSININPVVVRRELAALYDAGFIESKKGKEGGIKLLKKSADITISDIYKVIKNVEVLGKKNPNPNPKCPIGKDINLKLNHLFNDTEQIVERYLKQHTLEDFTKNF